MSSKGQVVIPEDVRRRLGLKAGSQFVVIAGDDAVVLKPVIEPDMSQFDDLLAEARSQARRAGVRKADITDAIREVRARG
jgi:AbrB family looped-hinge helix DNA binding protein